MMKFLRGLFAVLVVFAFMTTMGCLTKSEGVHQGKLLTFEKKSGSAFTTYGGEMILHGLTINQDGVFLNKFKFSTGDDELAKKIFDTKSCWGFVELKYTEERFTTPWGGDSKFVATDVKCLGQ